MVTNPFAEVYARMYETSDFEKFRNLPDMPLLIDIELTNNCNMSCMFCGNRAQTREKGFMTEETFNLVLNQIDVRTPLRFVRWGENMLHSRMLDFFRMAKQKGIMIHLTTNGTLLNDNIMQQFLEIPLDSIKFSFQGADEAGYKKMRNSSLFDKVMGLLKSLHKMRGELERPYIHVSSTMTDETDAEIDQFRNRVGQYCDSLDIGRTSLSRYDIFSMNLTEEEFARYTDLRRKESVTKIHMECPEVFDKLSINWDGTVSACCGDYNNLFVVGDIRSRTLREIWHGKQMNEIRQMLLRGDHDKLSLCSSCYSPYDFVRKKEKVPD
jgi:radical SAM protein with 4Fe4S-binding SPASM domain